MRRWQTIRDAFGRHGHRHAYATLVLSGSYEEAGDSGRHWVRPGDVILHEPFEAHLDRIPRSGARVLNLHLPDRVPFRAGVASVPDPDAIVACAEISRTQALALLLSSVVDRRPECSDWPDALATLLARDASVELSGWGDRNRISPWELSRGFARVFSISPSAFRARMRARHAWRAIRNTQTPLAVLAADLGFADQSHMTRSVTALTGRPPLAWRTGK